MSVAERFLDTNVLLYLLSADVSKADRAEELVADGGVVSVQVLNEFAAVALRKLGLTFEETREALAAVRSNCAVVPLTTDTHDLGVGIAELYKLSLYDAMIAASALLAGCSTLVSEDLQHGQVLETRLRVSNPFR
jgi:predicted nucleic acid-binding protein